MPLDRREPSAILLCYFPVGGSMSEVSQGPGWWQASDGKWYAPDLHPDHQASAPVDQPAVSSPAIRSDQVFAAADSAPVFAAADSAPVFAAADSAPVFAAADSAPVFAAADSAAPAFPAVGSDPVFATADQSGPAAYPSVQYPDVPTSGNKSKTTAGLLAIFLGALGIHRFYMGYKLIGAIMFLITVASLGRLAPITVLWGLVEGILIFTGKMKKDKYGGELT
jgi:TM2 domain-containing membrane protein YozV